MKKAFTLIELIVVIAIIAILALVVIPQVQGYISNAQEAVCTSNAVKILQDTRINITMDTDGSYKTTLVNLAGNGNASTENTETLLDDFAGEDGLNSCPSGQHYVEYNEGLDVITVLATNPDRVLATESQNIFSPVTSGEYQMHHDLSTFVSEYINNPSGLSFNLRKVGKNSDVKELFNSVNGEIGLKANRTFASVTKDGKVVLAYRTPDKTYYYCVEQEDGSIITYKGDNKKINTKNYTTAADYEEALMEKYGYVISDESPIIE